MYAVVELYLYNGVVHSCVRMEGFKDILKAEKYRYRLVCNEPHKNPNNIQVHQYNL